jgi:hypothetical protein
MKMKFTMLSMLLMLLLNACATGISTYDYTHNADGSTTVHVKSANEINNMQMGINRETGTLEVTIGELTKKSDTAEILGSVKEIVHDVVMVATPQK